MLEFVDTHCHIQFADYELDPEEVISDALASGVTRMICVGCSLSDSKLGIEFAKRHKSIWASIGVHPHEAKHYVNNSKALQELRSLAEKPRVVAVGEIGLDYFYNHSTPNDQKKLFRYQLNLASELNLPVILHIRDAFDDFFKIYDEFYNLKAVVHSFTASENVLNKLIERNLYIGLNGIMTFTKDQKQLEMAKKVPLNRLILETDAPFLTPVPFRGTICQPSHVVNTAEFLASLRQTPLKELALATTQNAIKLFNL